VDINIRIAQAPELESIIALQSLSLSHSRHRARQYDRRQVASLVCGQADARRNYAALETILVAEDRHCNLVGFAAISVCESTICGLFVHPDVMSRGIGSQLLIGIEKIAISNRISNLWVMSSVESIDFYRKYGYIMGRESGFFSIGSIWIPCRMLHKELKIPSRAQLLLQKLALKR
jgi:N-acetylglutamate synthase-like GNAT family acetyltransferase